MIEFYKFEPQFGLRDASPFCLKLMTYLKLAGVPHNTHEIMDPRKAPKQKMPFIIDDGKEIGDSEIIITHLKEKYGDPLAEGLSNEQKAVSHAFNIMFAERYYWAALVYPRWLVKENQPLMRDAWFGNMPKFFRGFVSSLVFKEIAKRSKGHGIGMHQQEDIYAMAINDLHAIEALMGHKDYMLDDKPRELDATAYAFLSNTVCESFKTPMQNYVENSARLMAYIERIDAVAFGD